MERTADTAVPSAIVTVRTLSGHVRICKITLCHTVSSPQLYCMYVYWETILCTIL